MAVLSEAERLMVQSRLMQALSDKHSPCSARKGELLTFIRSMDDRLEVWIPTLGPILGSLTAAQALLALRLLIVQKVV